MYDYRGIKHFCRYSLKALRTAGLLKFHINDCFKVNGKHRIMMPKKVNRLDSKIMREK